MPDQDVPCGKAAYFPSYELAFQLFGNPCELDNRHIRPEVAARTLNVFSAVYTDLPVAADTWMERETPVRSLEERIRQLEHELLQKENVIRELDLAAKERLAITEKWVNQ